MNRLTIASIILLLLSHVSGGQVINFSRLNTSSGLTGNNAQSITIDKNGFLWIGTNDGLNVYDGYSVTSFVKEKYPEMASDVVLHLVNDSHNRTWIGTYAGASWVDESRSFHRVVIRDSITKFRCPTIFETAAYGIVLHTGKGEFYFDSTAGKWKELDWVPPLIKKGNFVDAEPLDRDKIIFVIDSLVTILDYKTRQIIFQQSFALPLSVCPASDTTLAVGLKTGQIAIVSIASGKRIANYQLVNQLGGKQSIPTSPKCGALPMAICW